MPVAMMAYSGRASIHTRPWGNGAPVQLGGVPGKMRGGALAGRGNQWNGVGKTGLDQKRKEARIPKDKGMT